MIFQEYFRGGSAMGGAGGAQQRVFWNWEVSNCDTMKWKICKYSIY